MNITKISAVALLLGFASLEPAGAETLMQTARLLKNLSKMNLQTIGTERGSPPGSVETLFGRLPDQAAGTVYLVRGATPSTGWGTTSFGTTTFGRTSFGRTSFGRTTFGRSSMGRTSFGRH